MNESKADLTQSDKLHVAVDGRPQCLASREAVSRITKRLTHWHSSSGSRALLAFAFAAGVGVMSEFLFEPLVLQAHAQSKAPLKPGNLENAKLDPATVTGQLPDQAHVMADVGYHFANLWFAADKQNWPLANYYLSETRSHLKWAVRIHPVRQTKAGEVDLNVIAQAIDNSLLAEIGSAISNKDSTAFKTVYRQTLEGCYACHTACEKPFLRPQIPDTPGDHGTS